MANYYTPAEMTKSFTDSAVYKSGLPISKFVVMAILGGVFIAFGGLLSVMVAGGMPAVGAANLGVVKFVAGALFPVGLIMVSVTGADLFTSDCAAYTLSTLQRKTTVVTMLKYLLLSYLLNFIGTQIVAFLMSYEVGLLDKDPWQNYLHGYCDAKVNQSWSKIFLKGVGANWLVCLGMFMGYSAKDITGKCVAIWIPVMLFVTLGYEHSVANMFFVPAAIYSGADIAWSDFIIHNLIPATIGNLIGGSLLVGCVYWFLNLRAER